MSLYTRQKQESRGDIGFFSNDIFLQKTIKFGDGVQDVMSAVGAPNRIFYKSEDKMKIHSPNAHRKASLLKSDYFYNYFTFGMVGVTLFT